MKFFNIWSHTQEQIDKNPDRLIILVRVIEKVCLIILIILNNCIRYRMPIIEERNTTPYCLIFYKKPVMCREERVFVNRETANKCGQVRMEADGAQKVHDLIRMLVTGNEFVIDKGRRNLAKSVTWLTKINQSFCIRWVSSGQSWRSCWSICDSLWSTVSAEYSAYSAEYLWREINQCRGRYWESYVI